MGLSQLCLYYTQKKATRAGVVALVTVPIGRNRHRDVITSFRDKFFHLNQSVRNGLLDKRLSRTVFVCAQTHGCMQLLRDTEHTSSWVTISATGNKDGVMGTFLPIGHDR